MATTYVYQPEYDSRGWFDAILTSSGWFDEGFSESSGPPPSTTGQIKVFLGSFIAKPVKVWDGSAWNIKPVKHWTGTLWEETNY